MAKDFYKTLGVSKSSTPDEIKKAYRKLAVEFHPDRNKSKEAEDKFKEISEAYEVLSDPKKKQAYDQYGDAAFQNGAGGQGPFGQGFGGQQGPFRYQYYSSGGGQQGPFDFGNFQDPFDIFEQFFGGGMGQPRKPQYALRIEFMEAVKGTTRRINVNGKEKEIKIPPGVDTGSRINFDDFTIVIEARGDSRFQRQGADIVTEEKITFTQATLGDTIEVKTVQGNVKLKIPEGTQPDALIRIKDKGMPHVKGSGKGDHYVRVKVEIPKKINGRQKELLTEFAEESKKRHWF